MQTKLNQFFTDPQTGNQLDLYANNAIIVRPQTIWEFLDFLDNLSEDMRVKSPSLYDINLESH